MRYPIRISICEDNNHLRQSLELMFAAEPDFMLCASMPDCNHIERHVRESRPDIILMDIDMPGMTGIEGMVKVLGIAPDTIVIMFTIFEDDEKVFDALRHGAKGYILKKTSNDKILQALKDIYEGGSYMTPSIARKVLATFVKPKSTIREDYQLSTREDEILQLLVKGYSYKMIAAACFISIDTVRTHIKKIYQKLQVNSNVEAVKIATGKGSM